MKTLVILVLTLGIVVSVIANPVSKQTIQSENKKSPQADSSDSQTKHGEVINMSNKGDQEQKKDTPIENPKWPNIIDASKSVDADGTVEFSIEENIIKHGPEEKIKCDHDQKKYSQTENSNIDSDNNVEIIIEENIVSSIEDSPQQGEFADGPQLQGDFSEKPQLPGFIEDGPPMPNLVEGPQVTGFAGIPQLPGELLGPQIQEEFASVPQQLGSLAGGPQLPGFPTENPQLAGFMETIPQLAGFIQGGPQISGFNIDDLQQPQDLEDDFHIDKDYFRDDMQKVEHEIMETAAGFIPTPLVFRRKQKPRRRFATRRHFRRNPYRRHQFYHPYSYYAFYRPSSLRYYY